jgi:Homeodomain-like domain
VVRGGFLSADDRRAPDQACVGRPCGASRGPRRANAIVLLDRDRSCERVAAALLLDGDTVRDWYRAYERGGVAGMKSFGHEAAAGRRCELADKRPSNAALALTASKVGT